MTREKRRHFTADEKATILRRHLMDKVAVSDLCDEYKTQPSLFYFWQRQAFENLGTALEDRRTRVAESSASIARQRTIEKLQAQLQKKDSIIAFVSEEHLALKKTWGELRSQWVPPDLRDEVVEFVKGFSIRTELPKRWLLVRLAIHPQQFSRWEKRYGSVNHHNGKIPRDHWLEDWEKDGILGFHELNPIEGYRRLSFMMLDEDVVAVSPATVYRVLRKAGGLDRFNREALEKGTGFQQPVRAHEHWHADVTYINIAGTFYYLCALLDGYSRYLVHWEIRERMTSADVETIVQRAREKFPGERPRIISDNGPQFIAKDFKEFVRISGMTHVRTSPYYPQSNGKLERWNQTVKVTTIRPNAPGSLEEAQQLVASFVGHYNTRRLHSAIGYVTPADKLAGREEGIWKARDQKLEAARERRRQRREGIEPFAAGV